MKAPHNKPIHTVVRSSTPPFKSSRLSRSRKRLRLHQKMFCQMDALQLLRTTQKNNAPTRCECGGMRP